MPDMIHVTLQYSNAVLVALLPIFSDFAKKLDLPVPVPITAEQVQHFATGGPVIPGHPIDVKGYLVLTNGWRFWYSWGHVDSFESPDNYFALGDIDRISDFFGELNLTRKEAVSLAREALKRAGYSQKLPRISKRPSHIEGPYKLNGKTLPYYRVEWRWKTGNSHHAVEVHVDAKHRKVTKLQTGSTNLWEKPPDIGVKVELESEYRKRVMEGKQIHRRDPPPERLPAP